MMIRWWWIHKVKDGEVHKVKDKVHKEDQEVHKVEKYVTKEVGKDMIVSRIQGQI